MRGEDRDRGREEARQAIMANIAQRLSNHQFGDALALLRAHEDAVLGSRREIEIALADRALVAEAGKREAEEQRDIWRHESIKQHRCADEAEERATTYKFEAAHWARQHTEAEERARIAERSLIEWRRAYEDPAMIAAVEALEAEIATLTGRAERLAGAAARQNEEISQTLGKALAYPWFKDDQENFPGATEESGVCVGDEVAETLALMAADRLDVLMEHTRSLEAEVAQLKAERDEWRADAEAKVNGQRQACDWMDGRCAPTEENAERHRDCVAEIVADLRAKLAAAQRRVEELQAERDVADAAYARLLDCLSSDRPRAEVQRRVEKLERLAQGLLWDLSDAESAVHAWRHFGGQGSNVSIEDRGRFPSLASQSRRREASILLAQGTDPKPQRTCIHCHRTAEELGPIGMWQHCPEHEGGSLQHDVQGTEPKPEPEDAA